MGNEIYIGVAFDKAKEVIRMASFMEEEEGETEEDARRSAERQCPGLPIFTFRMNDEPVNIRNALSVFLTEQGVPVDDHLAIFALIAESLDGLPMRTLE